MARARGARSGAARPARARLQGGGTRPRPRAQLLARAGGETRMGLRTGRPRKGRPRGRSGRGDFERNAAAAAGFSAALLLLPPPDRQRLTGRAALRCRCDARCRCCCRRPFSAAALHVPRLGGSPSSSGDGGGCCCRGRGGGSTSRAAQPRELLPAFPAPLAHRAASTPPRASGRAPLPAPRRRLTRAGTCSPRPRGIRRLAGLLSGAQVAPAAVTPALPPARGRLRAPPAGVRAHHP